MSSQGKRVELELFCALTDEELRSRGMALVETVTAIDETNSARTQTMREFKERLMGLVEQQRKLSCVIRAQAEKRMVPCMMLFHVPSEGTKRIVRLDTGEVVREEAMTPGELQLNIFSSQTEFTEWMRGQGGSEATPEAKADEAETECHNCEKVFLDDEIRMTTDGVPLCLECWKACSELNEKEPEE